MALVIVLVASLVGFAGPGLSPWAVVGAPPVAAQPAPVTGIDIASWQHPGGQPIDWAAVRGDGHAFAVIKATEGASSPGGGRYVNPWFAEDWEGAGSAGLLRGAYHYAQPTDDPASAIADAQHFLEVTGRLDGDSDLAPVLDLEEHNGLAPEQVASWSAAWLDEVERLTGRVPIIYTGPWFWDRHVASTDFTRYPLWLASYTSAPDPGRVPGGWPQWTIWQWTSEGVVSGITGPVDLNRVGGDLATLEALTPDGASGTASSRGALDLVRYDGAGLEIRGWAASLERSEPVEVRVLVDGRPVGEAVADALRPDVARVHPEHGPNRGVAAAIPVTANVTEVCLHAVDADDTDGAVTVLGCEPPVSEALGVLDRAEAVGGGDLRLRGWAVGTGSAEPTSVRVEADGEFVTATTADVRRLDVAAAVEGAGPRHGFDLVVHGVDRTSQLCVRVGSADTVAAAPPIWCGGVERPSVSPFGHLDVVRRTNSGLRVAGWAIDPDVSGPVGVKVVVDGAVVHLGETTRERTDVDAVHANSGTAGFEVTVPEVAHDSAEVCVLADNGGAGAPRLMGCGQIPPVD